MGSQAISQLTEPSECRALSDSRVHAGNAVIEERDTSNDLTDES